MREKGVKRGGVGEGVVAERKGECAGREGEGRRGLKNYSNRSS